FTLVRIDDPSGQHIGQMAFVPGDMSDYAIDVFFAAPGIPFSSLPAASGEAGPTLTIVAHDYGVEQQGMIVRWTNGQVEEFDVLITPEPSAVVLLATGLGLVFLT